MVRDNGVREKQNESELIESYRSGSSKALEDIFEINKVLVNSVYNKFFKNSGCPKEDLIQEGYLGLFEAVRRFNPDYSSRFWGYKEIWIKKKMFVFRQKFFKLRYVEIDSKVENIPYEESRSEKLRRDFFELDSLVKSGKIPKSKAERICQKIIKGKIICKKIK